MSLMQIYVSMNMAANVTIIKEFYKLSIMDEDRYTILAHYESITNFCWKKSMKSYQPNPFSQNLNSLQILYFWVAFVQSWLKFPTGPIFLSDHISRSQTSSINFTVILRVNAKIPESQNSDQTNHAHQPQIYSPNKWNSKTNIPFTRHQKNLPASASFPVVGIRYIFSAALEARHTRSEGIKYATDRQFQ